MPPKASPKDQTRSPQPTDANPPKRDHRPRGATSSHRPIPTWIHTVADAAWIGWFDQMVTPLFTRCCTQPGDPLAAGWITPDGSPSGMEDWICSSPSKIQRAPKPIRRSRRAVGSGRGSGRAEGNEVCPWAFSLRYWTVRKTLKPIAQTSPRTRTTMSWWKSAV